MIARWSLAFFVLLSCSPAPAHYVGDGMTPGVFYEHAECGDALIATTCTHDGCVTKPIIIWWRRE
jgi:hypothetical protein